MFYTTHKIDTLHQEVWEDYFFSKIECIEFLETIQGLKYYDQTIFRKKNVQDSNLDHVDFLLIK
jgi:hypothetical protein